MIQLVELVGGIPKRRRRPDYGSLAFVLGYTTAQLRNAYQRLMEETLRQSQELGSAMGSLLGMLLAQQAAATGSAQGNSLGQAMVGSLPMSGIPTPSQQTIGRFLSATTQQGG